MAIVFNVELDKWLLFMFIGQSINWIGFLAQIVSFSGSTDIVFSQFDWLWRHHAFQAFRYLVLMSSLPEFCIVKHPEDIFRFE